MGVVWCALCRGGRVWRNKWSWRGYFFCVGVWVRDYSVCWCCGSLQHMISFPSLPTIVCWVLAFSNTELYNFWFLITQLIHIPSPTFSFFFSLTPLPPPPPPPPSGCSNLVYVILHSLFYHLAPAIYLTQAIVHSLPLFRYVYRFSEKIKVFSSNKKEMISRKKKESYKYICK